MEQESVRWHQRKQLAGKASCFFFDAYMLQRVDTRLERSSVCAGFIFPVDWEAWRLLRANICEGERGSKR